MTDQNVINAEIKKDIKYIRVTLDQLVNSIKDLKIKIDSTSEQTIVNKLNIDDIKEEVVNIKKWFFFIGTIVAGAIVTALLGLIIN